MGQVAKQERDKKASEAARDAQSVLLALAVIPQADPIVFVDGQAVGSLVAQAGRDSALVVFQDLGRSARWHLPVTKYFVDDCGLDTVDDFMSLFKSPEDWLHIKDIKDGTGPGASR